jgi:hypothetical protein
MAVAEADDRQACAQCGALSRRAAQEADRCCTVCAPQTEIGSQTRWEGAVLLRGNEGVYIRVYEEITVDLYVNELPPIDDANLAMLDNELVVIGKKKD